MVVGASGRVSLRVRWRGGAGPCLCLCLCMCMCVFVRRLRERECAREMLPPAIAFYLSCSIGAAITL